MGPDVRTVAEVVVRLPKTLGRAATVAQARSAFERDHVHMLLLTDDGQLLGTLVRADLPDDAPGADPALGYAVLEGRTIPPSVGVEQARQLLLSRGERRLAVVDGEGRLVGLLCLKRRRTGFCSDADVAARAADAGTRRGRAEPVVLVSETGGSLR
ncbi:CBS domain-containing protein [Nocardioides sp. LMS-CY]|uniref:CBS domain-containing protein n=1 Tax=Nocardioides soli TaxID=1036020 RepID=A0A7W4Z563_9ACTN|nr:MULTISPECIES: CBS domain-containing protein [Nocardioides]MBB3045470.1 CBS domain-containing protein [Nocardioides soli]QWF22457.1 CBS domain-containing protein [Nocardioides sp. LMS-CY]